MMNIKFIIASVLSSFLLSSHAGTVNNDCYNCRLNTWSLNVENAKKHVQKHKATQNTIVKTAKNTEKQSESFYKSQHCVCSSNKRWAVIEGENRHSIDDLEDYLFQAPVFVHNELINQNITRH